MGAPLDKIRLKLAQALNGQLLMDQDSSSNHFLKQLAELNGLKDIVTRSIRLSHKPKKIQNPTPKPEPKNEPKNAQDPKQSKAYQNPKVRAALESLERHLALSQSRAEELSETEPEFAPSIHLKCDDVKVKPSARFRKDTSASPIFNLSSDD